MLMIVVDCGDNDRAVYAGPSSAIMNSNSAPPPTKTDDQWKTDLQNNKLRVDAQLPRSRTLHRSPLGFNISFNRTTNAIELDEASRCAINMLERYEPTSVE